MSTYENCLLAMLAISRPKTDLFGLHHLASCDELWLLTWSFPATSMSFIEGSSAADAFLSSAVLTSETFTWRCLGDREEKTFQFSGRTAAEMTRRSNNKAVYVHTDDT
eukprot:scaffold46687_cov17-Prasinocladus_malaysianus.AAC.1